MENKLVVRSLSRYSLQLLEMMLKTCQSLSCHCYLCIQTRSVLLQNGLKGMNQARNARVVRPFSVVSAVLYQYWSLGKPCKFLCYISWAIFLWLSSKENFPLPFCVSNKIELIILCLWMSPHLSSRISSVSVGWEYLFESNVTKRSNTGLFLQNCSQAFNAVYSAYSSLLSTTRNLKMMQNNK